MSESLSLPALAMAVVRRPRVAMADLAEHPGHRWVVPLVAAVVLAVAAGVTGASAGAAASQAALPPEVAEMEDMPMTGDAFYRLALFGGIVGGLLGTLVAAVCVAAVFHLVGTILGGQQSFGQMFTATAWARLPLAFQSAARTLHHLAGGFDGAPEGLSGLVADATGAAAYAGPFLAEISVWNLWTLFLLALATQAVAKVSGQKAAAAVLVFVGAKIALGLAGIGLGQAFSGWFGG